MILVILIVAAFALFLVAVLDRPSAHRNTWIAVLGTLLIASVAAIAANDASRFGMTTTTKSQTVAIVGAANHTVFTVPIGANHQTYAVAYRKNPLSKRVTVARPGIKRTVHLKRTAKSQATLNTVRTELRYKGPWAAFLFAGSGQNGQVLHTSYRFSIPEAWAVINRK